MNPLRTYALVIGINEYESPKYDNLHAAVNDADAMHHYIRTTLKVPRENIINLRNERATRKDILNGFRDLVRISGNPDSSPATMRRETSANPEFTPTLVSTTTTPTIPAPTPGTTSEAREDNSAPCIIIFYAGHGARVPKPVHWNDWASDDDFVEMLCPSDLGMIPRNSSCETEGIPDRTVCYYLNKISKQNGNNITLILDCCCSGGMNRNIPVGTRAGQYYPRSIANPPALSGKVDLEVSHEINDRPALATRGMRTSKGFGGQFQDSHVLLAACGKNHPAYEEKRRGLFTTALLKLLLQMDLRTTTYASLMRRMLLPPVQTPHYSGSNIDRPLFHIQGGRPDPSYIGCTVTVRKQGEQSEVTITLEVGTTYGVNLNDRFSIHKTNLPEARKMGNPSIGTLMVTSVSTGKSILGHPPGHRKFKLPKACYAKRIGWSNDKPKVFCKDGVFLSSIFPPAMGEIVVVSEPAEASLVLEKIGEEVYISHTDPEMIQYIPARFPHTFKRKSPDDIRMIIKAWQEFEFHLRQNGTNKFEEVRMEMHYLKPVDGAPDLEDLEDEDFEASNFEPMGQNLLEEEPAEVSFSPINNNPVGITLYNDGDIPLYPYLFWFDPNDFTITTWFKSPDGAGDEVDAPLGPHSMLPVGYGGNGGVAPWQFDIEEGRDKDLGFFKLFLSVSPVNFSYLIQEEDDSPFKRLGRGRSRGVRDADEPIEEVLDPESWGCKLATIKQLRQ